MVDSFVHRSVLTSFSFLLILKSENLLLEVGDLGVSHVKLALKLFSLDLDVVPLLIRKSLPELLLELVKLLGHDLPLLDQLLLAHLRLLDRDDNVDLRANPATDPFSGSRQAWVPFLFHLTDVVLLGQRLL